MAILETGILFDNEVLVETKYYDSGNMIDKNIRNSLLQALTGFAKDAFQDEVQSFTIGDYKILNVGRDVQNPSDNSQHDRLVMFAIIEKNMDEKVVKSSLNEAVTQFLNRYSLNDIYKKQAKKFRDFPERLQKIFKDLILKSEDRFKSLF